MALNCLRVQSLKISQQSLRILALCAGNFSFNNSFSEKALNGRDILVRSLHVSHRSEAGHSKWQNIKHIKAANDREKGMKSNLFVQKLQQVFVNNPEKDPKLNTELANLIKWARGNNIPNDTIEKAIDRLVKLRDPKAITVIDGRGPSNVGLVMECFSLKPVHTQGILQGIVRKYGFNLNSQALDLFEHSGIVDVSLPEEELQQATADPDNFSLDKYIDLAIEASAEEVTLEAGPYGLYLQFTCSPFEISRVHKSLEEQGLTVTNSERTYTPTTIVPVSQEFLVTLEKLSEKLDIHPDVIKYYFNVVPEN